MKLEILIGPEDGCAKEINLGKTFTVGRGHDRDLSLPYGAAVTRRHGEICKDSDRFLFRDTGNRDEGSRHGTLIKRHEEEMEFRGDEREIQPGDVLVLGKCIWLRVLA